MRRCPRCNKWELDVTGKEVELKENFLFRCWNCGYECDLIEAEENNYPSEAIATTDLNKKERLLKQLIKNLKMIMKVDESISPEENLRLFKKEIIKTLEKQKPVELKESKKICFDKRANQFSIKIPKSLALKARLKKNSIVYLVLKTKKDKTLEKIKQSKFVIFLK